MSDDYCKSKGQAHPMSLVRCSSDISAKLLTKLLACLYSSPSSLFSYARITRAKQCARAFGAIQLISLAHRKNGIIAGLAPVHMSGCTTPARCRQSVEQNRAGHPDLLLVHSLWRGEAFIIVVVQ